MGAGVALLGEAALLSQDGWYKVIPGVGYKVGGVGGGVVGAGVGRGVGGVGGGGVGIDVGAAAYLSIDRILHDPSGGHIFECLDHDGNHMCPPEA